MGSSMSGIMTGRAMVPGKTRRTMGSSMSGIMTGRAMVPGKTRRTMGSSMSGIMTGRAMVGWIKLSRFQLAVNTPVSLRAV